MIGLPPGVCRAGRSRRSGGLNMRKHRDTRALRSWLARLGPACMLLLALAPSPALAAQERGEPAQDAEASSEAKFLRFEDDPTGGGTLQTSIVRYANDDGATVDLIGAVHVGDRAYYDLLNERFK